MCNACNFRCCGCDRFGACGCDDCDNEACHSGDGEESEFSPADLEITEADIPY